MRSQEMHNVRGIRAHAEKHGDGFVDGVGRDLGEPGIANAPGGQSSDREGDRREDFATNILKQSGIKSVLGGAGVEIDLNGPDVGQSLKIGDLSGELFSGLGGEDWRPRIANPYGRFDADDGDQWRSWPDTERLEARPNDEMPGIRLETDSLGKKRDSDWLALEKAEVFRALPSPEDDVGEIGRSR